MIDIDVQGIARLKATLEGTRKKLSREMAIVVNKTAKKTKSLIAKKIGKVITLPQKNIKKLLSVPTQATPEHISATVTVKGTKRINLKFYKARETKTGVTTKVFRAGAAQVDAGAFKVARYKGRVIKRVGKQRGPLQSLSGPSAAEIFKDFAFDEVQQETKDELTKQLNERIRFLTLKQSGAI